MKSVAWNKRVGVWIGIGTGPGALMVGGGLAARLSLPLLLLAVVLGALSLTALAVAQGVISRRRREPLTARAVSTFGPIGGAALLNLAVAIVMTGWVSFYVNMVGLSWSTYLDVRMVVCALVMIGGMYALGVSPLPKVVQCVFGVSKQWVKGIELSGISQRPGASDTEPWPGAHHLAGQSVNLPHQSLQLDVADHSEGLPFTQTRRSFEVPGRQRMAHGFSDQLVLLVPFARLGVQRRYEIRLCPAQSFAQQIGK